MKNEIEADRRGDSPSVDYNRVALIPMPVLRSTRKLMTGRVKLSLGVLVGALYATSSFAALTAVGPFTGTYSETFDGFPPQSSQVFVPDPSLAFGGHATMTGSSYPALAIYNSFSPYLPVDGNQLAVSQYNSLTTSFAFDSHLNAFGGYFGTGIFGGSVGDKTDFKVTFRDASGSVVGTDTQLPASNAALNWLGWHSDTPFTTVEISAPAGFYVMDSLQAQAVPEPSTVFAGALLLVPFAFSGLRTLAKGKNGMTA
jgi:hypothetical protein